MTWTRINPGDPKTYPESGKRVDFVINTNGREALGRGEWEEELAAWIDDETDGNNDHIRFYPGEVTHWQPIPALPGEEAESKAEHDPGHPHLINGEFQSDKYPTCPRGKVPLSCKDPTAQDLLWEYAQRRRAVDSEFATDLELALNKHGYQAEPKAEHPAELVEREEKLK